MKNDGKIRDRHNIDWDADYSPRNIASATDCTGMMYRPPVSDEEAENYGDIYGVPQQTDTAAQQGVATNGGRTPETAHRHKK
jgi:hypothetical protein